METTKLQVVRLRTRRHFGGGASTRLAALCAAICLSAATAEAANAAPAVASWTGCYVGVNGGYGWNNGRISYNDVNVSGGSGTADADPINHVADVNGGTDAYIPTPTSVGGSGALAGLEGGCNWQAQQSWVLGVEADLGWANIGGTNTTSANSGPLQYKIGPATALVPLGLYTGLDTTGTANEQASVHWLSTIRARGGFALQQNLLLYGTGGLAIGGITTQGSVNILTPGSPSLTWSGADSTIKIGPVIGAGLEWAFYDRWTVKAEYLWYDLDLGSSSHPLNCSISVPNGCATFYYPTLGSVSTSISGSIVRAGINYKFW
jgi:outer membrane immunogenic protein